MGLFIGQSHSKDLHNIGLVNVASRLEFGFDRELAGEVLLREAVPTIPQIDLPVRPLCLDHRFIGRYLRLQYPGATEQVRI